MPTHHCHAIVSLSLSLQGVATYRGLAYWVSVLNSAFSLITALNTGFFVLFHMGSFEEYNLSQHSNESEHYASSMELATHRVTQLIALSDGIVWLWVPNGRSIAASSRLDSTSILNETIAMEQNTIGSMPNEAMPEENQSQKIPCEGHYCEGTLKRPSTPIRKQMVCSVTHWMAVSIITLNLVFDVVFLQVNTIVR